ncbi:MAG TPA: hypothetical protein VH969_13735 [Actinophytocola sp.]|uniref:hypothetical protein n=1 Tax=Actinophytocola sp. TaxID=1872138 RepID=UPI002F91D707
MSIPDADHRNIPPHGLADLAVNRLLRIGLDLNQALAFVGSQHGSPAGQRIRVALGRIDETIDELRLAIMPGHR